MDPVLIQKSKKNKNKLIKQKYNNISTFDSNFSSKNTNYISSNNINNNNIIYKDENIDNKKKNIKINISCLNEFIGQLNINKKTSNLINYNKYGGENEKLKNKNNKNDNNLIINKNYSVDNINYNINNYKEKKINNYKSKSLRENIKNKNKNKNNNNEFSFTYDLIQNLKRKKNKNNIYTQNSNSNLERINIKNKYLKNKNKCIMGNTSHKKIKKKLLNSSLDIILNNKYDINKNIYNNKELNNFYSLIMNKRIVKNNLKKSISDLENSIKIFNINEKRKEEIFTKIIDYNKLIISNIEKTKHKINNSILLNNDYINKNNYDYDNEVNKDNKDNDIINKGIEINEQIMIMKKYIDNINKFNNLLNQIIKEEIKLNNKLEKDIIVYKKNLLNREEKLKILEKNSKIIGETINQLKIIIYKFN